MAMDDRLKGGISRRTFLMGALAAASAPAFFNSARAQDGGGPNDRMLLGCVGLGRQGMYDIKEAIYQGMDANVHLVAICDIDTVRVDRAKKQIEKIYADNADKVNGYAGLTTYTDLDEMLKHEGLDAVIVAVPDHWHGLAALAALRAGKDVYLEKPMTLMHNEGVAVVKAVRQLDRILQVGTQQRSSQYFRKACEIARNGRLGNLQHILVTLPVDGGAGDETVIPVPEGFDFDKWCGPAPLLTYTKDRAHSQTDISRPGWIQNEAFGRGMITNWGAHMNDIAQWGNGTDDSGLVEIETRGSFPRRGTFNVHTTFEGHGKFSNGVKITQRTGAGDVRFEGDEGWVQVSREGIKASDNQLIREKLPESAIHLYASKNHMRNFFDCVRSRKEPASPVEVGHRSNTVCIVSHISMKLGRRLEWDPVTEKFKNDEEANSMLSYEYRGPWKLDA